jgi:hypothetical protein
MMDEERDGRIAGVEYGNTGSVPNFFLKRWEPPLCSTVLISHDNTGHAELYVIIS